MAQKVLYNNSGRISEIALSPSSVDLGNVTNDLQIPKSIVTAKGDIITATASDTPVRQGVGSNGQIIVADSNLTNGLGYKDPAFRNWVINGNFDIAQRGTSFTNPADGVYTVDRIRMIYSKSSGLWPSNLIHSQQALTPGEIENSFYFYRISTDGAGSSFDDGSYYGFMIPLEHATRYLCGNGKKVTISFYARSSIANKKLGFYIHQEYGTGGSPTGMESLTGNNETLTSSWVKYTYTFTTNTLSGKTFGTNNDDKINLLFFQQWGVNGCSVLGGVDAETFVGAGNIDIAQVALYAGDVAYPFEPVPFDVELQRCMRYYEKSYDHSVLPGTNTPNGLIETGSLGGNCNIGDYIMPHINFKVSKRTIPTINLYQQTGGSSGYVGLRRNSGNVTADVSASIVSTLSCDSFQVVCQSTRVDERSISFHYTADADF